MRPILILAFISLTFSSCGILTEYDDSKQHRVHTYLHEDNRYELHVTNIGEIIKIDKHLGFVYILKRKTTEYGFAYSYWEMVLNSQI